MCKISPGWLALWFARKNAVLSDAQILFLHCFCATLMQFDSQSCGIFFFLPKRIESFVKTTESETYIVSFCTCHACMLKHVPFVLDRRVPGT